MVAPGRFPRVIVLAALGACAALAGGPARIVLIAGKKSHGPGAHEYVKSVKLLKVLLDRANLRGVRTEVHFNGWPEDPRVLATASTIMMISDGQDGDRYSPVPFMTPERMAVMERQMKRGCGLVTFHFSTFTPDAHGAALLDWTGGYFDWQDDTGKRNWYSAIKTLDTRVELGDPTHPVVRGVEPAWQFKDEFYYKIRFRDQEPRLKPILRVPALGGSAAEQTVAWAVERSDGGRGFGTTTGHFFDNWKDANYRKLILNAIAWTAKVEVPAGGIRTAYAPDAEVDRVLAPKPVRALLLHGDNHPAHLWKQTTPAIIEALNNRGPEFAVTVTEDPESLANLDGYHLVILNYANWTRPGLSKAARNGLVQFVRRGGGLAPVHFANGAFHASLPQAPPSDWPEYRNLVRRVWDHAKGKSGHDRYGRFAVRIANPGHPVTRGLEGFETVDELYFRQQGTEPIEVLATARSNVTGADEPMAFVYRYGKGRVFQTVLGHSAESLGTHGMMQLLRRGAWWAAGRR